MIYAYWVRGKSFYEMAQLSIASVKKVDPKAQILIYTDDPEITGPSVCSMEPGRPAMVANLDAQINAISTSPYGERILFLDADTLLKKPFPFDGSDLVLTWRDHVAVKDGEKVVGLAKDQPWNYGVIGAEVSCRTIEAFIWLRARILKMTKEHQNWYGNQIAMFDLVGAPNSSKKTATIRWTLDDRGTDLMVKCLPCEIWNWTPESPDEDIVEKGIIHVKGNRKDMMEGYAKKVLSM